MKKQFWQRTERMFQWLALACVTGWLAAGCTTPSPNNDQQATFSPLPGQPTTAPVSEPGATNAAVKTSLTTLTEEGGVLAVGDLVTVKFSGTIEQIPPHEERIKDDGTITLPLIGAVQAAGKTTGDLQKKIHERYVPDYYVRLTVTVTGEQRVYYVGGQVRQPGRQAYLGITTVTKAIQSAGDFTDFAAKTRVELTRADGKTITLDCAKAAKDPSLDLQVFPGDKIHVPQRDWRDILR